MGETLIERRPRMRSTESFLADIKEIRRRARQDLDAGAVTHNYSGKVEGAIALLNHAVATEIVCILRYKFHAVCAAGLASEAVKEEFAVAALAGDRAGCSLLVVRNSRATLAGVRPLNPVGGGTARNLAEDQQTWPRRALAAGYPPAENWAHFSPNF
jgi:hypothetical protein